MSNDNDTGGHNQPLYLGNDPHLRKPQTYNDVLQRIYGLISEEAPAPCRPHFPNQTHQKPPTHQAITRDIEKNHAALKQMIKLIDSRNAAQQQVSEVAGTGFKRGTATISAESNGSEQKQNRRQVSRDLTEVREELRKVIRLIDSKLSGSDCTQRPQAQIQTPKDREKCYAIRQANNSRENEDLIRMPPLGTDQTEGKRQGPESPGQQRKDFLNLKQSFDLMADEYLPRQLSQQTSCQNETVKPESRRYQTSPESSLFPIRSSRNQKSLQPNHKLYHFSYMQQGRPQSPPVRFVVPSRPASILPRYISLEPKTLLGPPQITISPRKDNLLVRPVSPRFYSPPHQRFTEHVQTIQPIQAKGVREQKKLLELPVPVRESTLKKASKAKGKFSFRDHQLGRTRVIPESRNKVGCKVAGECRRVEMIQFPKAFEHDSKIENPFNSWKDKPQEQTKMEMNEGPSDSSLTSIPELRENSSQLTIIQQFGNGSQSDPKSSLYSRPRQSLMARSGDKSFKRRGIGLFQPTYSGYFPVNQ